MKREIHKINADGQILGRLAANVAILLRGKHRPNFVPHVDSGDIVEINNVAKMKISGKKMEQKIYWRHSGRPGGIKGEILGDLFKKDPAKVLYLAVYRMLPKNKLRDRMIKRLKFN